MHGRVDVTRPSAGSRLEEDLRNAFIMRRRFTAQLVNIYITSNNTSSKQGGPIRAMNINDLPLRPVCDLRCIIGLFLATNRVDRVHSFKVQKNYGCCGGNEVFVLVFFRARIDLSLPRGVLLTFLFLKACRAT